MTIILLVILLGHKHFGSYTVHNHILDCVLGETLYIIGSPNLLTKITWNISNEISTAYTVSCLTLWKSIEFSIQWQKVDHFRTGMDQLTEMWAGITLEGDEHALYLIMRW